MSHKKKNPTLAFLLVIVVATVTITWFIHRSTQPLANWLLYNQGDHSYIFDLETGEIRQIAQDVKAIGWSPRGQQILFRDNWRQDSSAGLWISKYDGTEFHQIFSMEDFANLELHSSLWLTDNIILITLADYMHTYVYSLEIQTMRLTQLDQDALPYFASPRDNYWIQSTTRDGKNVIEVRTLSEKRIKTGIYVYIQWRDDKPWADISPNGKQLIYPDFHPTSELWLIDIKKNSFSAPFLLAVIDKDGYLLNGQIHWAPDGTMIGYKAYKNGSYFQAIDAQSGEMKYNWPIKSRSNFFMWSPKSNAIITDDITDIWILNLQSGQSISILNAENTGSKAPIDPVDWRLIRLP